MRALAKIVARSEVTAMAENKPEESRPLDPLVARLLEDGLAIQDRFVAEPMLKTTGKGTLKSRGVEGLKQDIEELRAKYQAKQASHADRP
jgi:hypothetical protein